jgi:sensor histidine kinase YesM
MKPLSPQKRRIAIVVIHIVGWEFYMLTPLLFSLNEPNGFDSFAFRMWVPMLLSAVLFYANYLLLIDRFLFQKKIIQFIFINLLLIIVTSIASDIFLSLVHPFEPNFAFGPKRPPKIFFLGRHNLSLLFIVSISVAIRTTGRWYSTETQRKNLENENLKSELNNLKMQLNPHFFFNTLNNIYSLIQSSPEKAQESVHRLAKLMRYHLYETNEEYVFLAGEVEAMNNYIALMKLRLTSSVEIETLFLIENSQIKIAPLLFIPLIENAFKHGISSTSKSTIKILFEEKNNFVNFETINTNAPQTLVIDKEKEANGIGLENLQKRLLIIYPKRHTFETRIEDDIFRIKVTIEL